MARRPSTILRLAIGVIGTTTDSFVRGLASGSVLKFDGANQRAE